MVTVCCNSVSVSQVTATACPCMCAVTACMTVLAMRMNVSVRIPLALVFTAAVAPLSVFTRQMFVTAGASVLSMMMKTFATSLALVPVCVRDTPTCAETPLPCSSTRSFASCMPVVVEYSSEIWLLTLYWFIWTWPGARWHRLVTWHFLMCVLWILASTTWSLPLLVTWITFLNWLHYLWWGILSFLSLAVKSIPFLGRSLYCWRWTCRLLRWGNWTPVCWASFPTCSPSTCPTATCTTCEVRFSCWHHCGVWTSRCAPWPHSPSFYSVGWALWDVCWPTTTRCVVLQPFLWGLWSVSVWLPETRFRPAMPCYVQTCTVSLWPSSPL